MAYFFFCDTVYRPNGSDRILACDGQTERQTSCHGIVRAMHMRRAVKIQCQQVYEKNMYKKKMLKVARYINLILQMRY